MNPDALATAAELDDIYAIQGPVGLLHGVPVVIKDNIDFWGARDHRWVGGFQQRCRWSRYGSG